MRQNSSPAWLLIRRQTSSMSRPKSFLLAGVAPPRPWAILDAVAACSRVANSASSERRHDPSRTVDEMIGRTARHATDAAAGAVVAAPEVGQLVQVRDRHWVVSDVAA